MPSHSDPSPSDPSPSDPSPYRSRAGAEWQTSRGGFVASCITVGARIGKPQSIVCRSVGAFTTRSGEAIAEPLITAAQDISMGKSCPGAAQGRTSSACGRASASRCVGVTRPSLQRLRSTAPPLPLLLIGVGS